MVHTESIKLNREFRRLYHRGENRANGFLVIYFCKNRAGKNRLGITVSTKIGNAVTRNRVRRRIKEAYRLNESFFKIGFDIVIVARVRAAHSSFFEIQNALLQLISKSGLKVSDQ